MRLQKIFFSWNSWWTFAKSYRKTILAFVMVLVIGCGCSLFFFAQDNKQITAAADELASLITNIRRYYQNRPDYWGLNSQLVIEKKISPPQMQKNNVLLSCLGNEVLVGNGLEAETLMPGSHNFDVTYRNLAEKQCINLACFPFDQKFWLGVTGVTITNARQQQLFSWDDEENGLPIPCRLAEKICTETENTIIWHCEQ